MNILYLLDNKIIRLLFEYQHYNMMLTFPNLRDKYYDEHELSVRVNTIKHNAYLYKEKRRSIRDKLYGMA